MHLLCWRADGKRDPDGQRHSPEKIAPLVLHAGLLWLSERLTALARRGSASGDGRADGTGWIFASASFAYYSAIPFIISLDRADGNRARPARSSSTMDPTRARALAALLVLACGAPAAQDRNINFDLLQAARAGSVATVRSLLDQGASPNSRNRLGDTPLNLAARNGDLPLASLLLERGADVNQPNLARVSPLMSAAFGDHTEMLKLLLAAKADVTAVDRVQKDGDGLRRGPGGHELHTGRSSTTGWT